MAGRLSPGVQWSLAGLGWLAGVAVQLRQPSLDEASIYACWLALGTMIGVVAWSCRRARAALVLASACVAFGLSGWHAALLMEGGLSRDLEGDDLTLIGTIAAMPQASEDGVRVRVAVEEASREGRAGTAPRRVAAPALVALSWNRGVSEGTGGGLPPPAFKAGERWRLAVRLKRPHGSANPQGFDVELWALEQGWRATGSIRPQASSAVRLAPAQGHWIERARQWVRDSIMARVSDARAAGVLAALAVGDQGAIGRQDWDIFRQTGVAHVMSISGLHITMFSWLAGGIASIGWRRSMRLSLWWPAPLAARWCGVAASLGYALFSGWGVPAQRTACMLLVTAALQSLGVRWPWPLVLLSGAVAVTTWDPWALLQPGFWLSFMAVALLMASGPGPNSEGAQAEIAQVGASDDAKDGAVPADRRHGGARLLAACRALAASAGAGLRAQWIATLGLAPLTLVIFQQISLVGLMANLVAIPVVTFLVTPLALLGVAWPALWGLGAVAVQALCAVLARLAEVPMAVWNAPVVPPWAQWSALLGALVLLLPWPWRVRALGLPLVWPLAFPVVPVPPPGQFELVAVDVGQGTAVLIRTRKHLLVYDTGPRYTSESDAGQRVLWPLLRARGEPRVNLLVLSHRDTDHVGGAASLLASIRVDGLLSSLPAQHPLRRDWRRSGRPDEACEAGRQWTWDGVRFEVLYPAREDDGLAEAHPNRVSCVILVAAASVDGDEGLSPGVLLTGDIETEQERALVASSGVRLQSTVLVAPHHGSRTSSTSVLLETVRPRVVVFQAGYLNRFGHPAPDVVARYAERGIQREASASCGAWTWRSADGNLKALGRLGVCQRAVDHRYWHWQP